MNGVHCFTSATLGYLDRARILAETLRRQHPDWVFWLCLPDVEPVGVTFDPARDSFDRVVRLSDLDIPDKRRWIFDHDVIELCTAAKGPMLCRLLAAGASKVVYLDPDVAVFRNLKDIDSLLNDFTIILTPHLLEPEIERSAI